MFGFSLKNVVAKVINNVVEVSHLFLNSFVKEGMIFLDLTCGNGNDTLHIGKLLKGRGRVYAFDIQEKAIKNTKKLLEDNDIKNYTLVLDSHRNVDKYIDFLIDGAVYNLGYLPGGDKSIVTMGKEVISSLDYIGGVLKKGAIIILCCYLSHEGGMREYEEILSYITTLENKEYNIIDISYILRKKDSPRVIVIEKL